MEFLAGKPRSIVSLTSDATYEQIMYAIAHNKLDNRHLRATVTLCRSNPYSVVCIVYRSQENSILMLFGSQPTCVRAEGSKLESLMSAHCQESKIYIFTYVKEACEGIK